MNILKNFNVLILIYNAWIHFYLVIAMSGGSGGSIC